MFITSFSCYVSSLSFVPPSPCHLFLHMFLQLCFSYIYVSKLENDIVMILFFPRKNIDNPIASSPSSSTRIVSSFFLGFF